MKIIVGRSWHFLWAILLPLTPVLHTSCGSLLSHSTELDEVTNKRLPGQIYFEDSLYVFFAEFSNPYPDREVMWIASYLEGDVELRLHDMENDSLAVVYRFDHQESPLYPLAYRLDSDRLVKCVIHVNGRPKCARLTPWINALDHPQWGTTFSTEIF